MVCYVYYEYSKILFLVYLYVKNIYLGFYFKVLKNIY